MYGAKRYILSTQFGNRGNPNKRLTSTDEWAMTQDWPNAGGGWAPGSTFSVGSNNLGQTQDFITKNSEIEQNILP